MVDDGMKLGCCVEQKLRLFGENLGIGAMFDDGDDNDDDDKDEGEVRSKVIVGNKLLCEEWFGGMKKCCFGVLDCSNWWWLKFRPLLSSVGEFPKDVELLWWWRFWWCDDDDDVDEPDNIIDAAAEVVYAMADAVTWRGWLCVPSYVVIKIDISSAHLWTWNHIQEYK